MSAVERLRDVASFNPFRISTKWFDPNGGSGNGCGETLFDVKWGYSKPY